MTLVDIENILFSHFLTESTFDLNEDLPAIVLDPKQVGENILNHKFTLFKAALDDLGRKGIVLEIDPGLYFLIQPLTSFTQTLSLSPMAAEMVADLLYEVGTNGNNRPYVANKLAITSDDISTLCHICHMLLDGPELNSDPDLIS